ncbi:MAG: D-alanyl-D-alanine carboxypeptidase, partial [Rhizobiales bacterium]|nr:D-alanyl-D-alanine carboxypeptidase [Hyphomicrobiales bacterium]
MVRTLQQTFICMFAATALLLVGLNAAYAATFATDARHAILIDAGTSEVLFEKNADGLMPPASMSKLMTMVMVFEALKGRQLTLEDKFFVSENAWRSGGATSGGSTMYAKVNSDLRLEDLIRGVIVQSANDACIAIAEGLAGSEEAFGEAMTKRARELGLEKSVFKNATGLPDPEHKMTARELAKLARYIIYKLPEFYKYYSEREFTWNKITQQNRNPLLYMDIGADGLKTGYTREAGYGLVASAVRDGRRLIMVLGGMKSSKARRVEARKLLDWGFRRFRSFVLFQRGQTVGHARVWGGTEGWVQLMSKEPVRVMLTPDERKQVRAEVV